MIDKDLALMNAVKTVFPECTNLLCMFHIDKNVKAKCKSLIGEKMCGTMYWITGVLWLIVRSNTSSLSRFRSFKLFVRLGRCSLTMLTTHGLSPTKKNLLQHGRIRSCTYATQQRTGIKNLFYLFVRIINKWYLILVYFHVCCGF